MKQYLKGLILDAFRIGYLEDGRVYALPNLLKSL